MIRIAFDTNIVKNRHVRRAFVNDENKNLTEKIRWLLLLRVVIVSFFLGATALFHFFANRRRRGLSHQISPFL